MSLLEMMRVIVEDKNGSLGTNKTMMARVVKEIYETFKKDELTTLEEDTSGKDEECCHVKKHKLNRVTKHQSGKFKSLNYGEAIQALNEGKLLSRKGWNGKGMFIFKQIPSEIGLDTIPKMTSIPQSVKDIILKRGVTLKYSNQLAIVHQDGSVNGWVASVSDTLAEDWEIFQESTHVDRMNTELSELNKKLQNLEKFINSNPTFDNLSLEDQKLLKDQFNHMLSYKTVLEDRLSKLNNN